ncbi:MAG: hypothetical protein LBG80_19185 [Bacteroidales bacterium]|jgi:hypothetical protein|nr:hypothetical protein [Bacteroidales bacterium]
MISDETKLRVLNDMLEHLHENKEKGIEITLCCLFGIHFIESPLILNFKDFTRKNVMKVTGVEPGQWYWWKMRPFDYANRIKFLEWMIKRIQEGKEGSDDE